MEMRDLRIQGEQGYFEDIQGYTGYTGIYRNIQAIYISIYRYIQVTGQGGILQPRT